MSNHCVDVNMFGAEAMQSNEEACAYPEYYWPCPTCTYHNPAQRSYCDICFTKSPANDQSSSVDDHAVLLPSDVNVHQPPQLPPLYSQLYGQLQQGGGLVRSKSNIECPICLERIAIGQGIVLSECLHEFCLDCLAQTVRLSGESLVRCPAVSADAAICDGTVADIEIREILSEAEYAAHLQLSLRQAENRTTGSFHCKTPNCAGWCILENGDVPAAFDCPVCRTQSCMRCEERHPGQSCAAYRAMKSRDRENKMVDGMISQYVIMKCPTCQALVQKNGGCDHLLCTQCQTKFNWNGR